MFSNLRSAAKWAGCALVLIVAVVVAGILARKPSASRAVAKDDREPAVHDAARTNSAARRLAPASNALTSATSPSAATAGGGSSSVGTAAVPSSQRQWDAGFLSR